MKKNITVNIFGTLYPIDEDAYELLQKYNENMRRYYSRREDGDEIIDDVEHRVAELLSELQSQGVMAITIEHVKDIITRIGDPQEMDDSDTPSGTDNGTDSSNSGNSTHSSTHADNQANDHASRGTAYTDGGYSGERTRQQAADIPNGEMTRKLFRDPEDKILGGVLSGLSHYFGISEPIVLRLLMIILLIISFSTLTIIYIIAWILIPEAITPEDRLRMYGKPVSAKAINEELMRGVNATNEFVRNPHHQDTARGCLSAAIKFVLFCIGGFVVFILGCILFGLLMAIFGVSIAGILGGAGIISDIEPEFQAFIMDCPKWVAITTAISALMVVGIPLYGLIRALLRRSGEPGSSAWVKVALIVLWMVSLFTLIGVSVKWVRTYDVKLDKILKKRNTHNGIYIPGNGWATLRHQGWTVEKLDGVSEWITEYGTMPDDDYDTYVSLKAKEDPSQMFYNLSQNRQLRPGEYQISGYVRTDGEGNSLYVITNDGKDTLRVAVPPHVEAENEISDEEVVRDSNDPDIKWTHVTSTFEVKKQENVKYGITNESQLSDTPWNSRKIEIANVKISSK